MDIQQTFAKQVAHAKEVAETQHRKLQEDAAARLVRLEARQKLVATRRQKLLTVPRSRLLDLQSWSAEELENLQNVLEDSAVILQQWWRKMMLLPSIVLYKSSGVTLAEAKAMNFDSLIKKMTDQVLINNATAFIQRIKKTSPTQLKWKNPARVFLSAYMIAAHPAQTMPQMGTEEMVKDGGEKLG